MHHLVQLLAGFLLVAHVQVVESYVNFYEFAAQPDNYSHLEGFKSQ